MRNLAAGFMAMAVVVMSMTGFAGAWQQDGSGWWYQNDDGSYPKSEWAWIDGDGDGVSECYYFNDDGYCLMNTTTPDGSAVDENGAWVVDGNVQHQGTVNGVAAQGGGNTGGQAADLADLGKSYAAVIREKIRTENWPNGYHFALAYIDEDDVPELLLMQDYRVSEVNIYMGIGTEGLTASTARPLLDFLTSPEGII